MVIRETQLRRGTGRTARTSALGVAAALAMCLLSSAARANDPCGIDFDLNLNACQGDQSAGVDVNAALKYEMGAAVNRLTKPIAPAAGHPGAKFHMTDDPLDPFFLFVDARDAAHGGASGIITQGAAAIEMVNPGVRMKGKAIGSPLALEMHADIRTTGYSALVLQNLGPDANDYPNHSDGYEAGTFVAKLLGTIDVIGGIGINAYSRGGSAYMSISTSKSGGTGGAGGAMTLLTAGDAPLAISTSGDNFAAVAAYSIGGRGGNGFDDLFSTDSDGGGGGAGGAISITGKSWSLLTQGSAADALNVTSAGGVGGRGGESTFSDGGRGGDGGMGGAVSIDISGVFRTSGNGARGIVASSIGGSPGTTPDSDVSPGSNGKGGTVTVSFKGDITTTGNGAHGLLASSSGPYSSADGYLGKGGAVNVTVGGNISVSGNAAHGIVGLSLGKDGAGPIDITVAAGSTVSGGLSGSSGTSAGVAIFGGTNDNAVHNSGTITSFLGTGGVALLSEANGSIKVENLASGVIEGSINLTAGSNQVINDGVIRAGIAINLGPAGTLTNHALLSIGDESQAFTSVLTGTYLQSDTGMLAFSVLGKNAYSRLSTQGGGATFEGGTIAFDFEYLFTPSTGDVYTVFISTSAISGFDTLTPTFQGLLGTLDATLALSYDQKAIELLVHQYTPGGGMCRFAFDVGASSGCGGGGVTPPVPEPSTWLLFGLGLALLGAVRRARALKVSAAAA